MYRPHERGEPTHHYSVVFYYLQSISVSEKGQGGSELPFKVGEPEVRRIHVYFRLIESLY